MSATDVNPKEESCESIRIELARIYIRRKRKKGIELTVEDLLCKFPVSESEALELLSEIPDELKALLGPFNISRQ